MEQRACAVVLALLTSALAVAGLAGHSRFSGPVILAFGDSSHGIHRDDLFVVALWAVGLGICVYLWVSAHDE